MTTQEAQIREQAILFPRPLSSAFWQEEQRPVSRFYPQIFSASFVVCHQNRNYRRQSCPTPTSVQKVSSVESRRQRT
jgi:hypothetical protein